MHRQRQGACACSKQSRAVTADAAAPLLLTLKALKQQLEAAKSSQKA
jgi:hypothetical protein